MDVVIFGDNFGLPQITNALREFPSFNPVAAVYSHKKPHAAEAAAKALRGYHTPIIEQPPKNSPGFTAFPEQIKAAGARVGLCSSYDLILSSEILGSFPLGVINLHGALLPKYRGANVLNWVLVNGESETGMTMHKMAEKVDCGPILDQERIEIDFTDTALTLQDKMRRSSERLLKKNWPDIAAEKHSYTEQGEAKATVVHRRTPEDGFFSWDWPAERIYNMIRALVRPWPGAWYMEGEAKLVIDQFMPFEDVRRMQMSKLKQLQEQGLYVPPPPII